MTTLIRFFVSSLLLSFFLTGCNKTNNCIKLYPNNPRYWQYKGKPVLLLGGSKDDNLFQIDGLEEHLDEMQSIGGNFVRNTMSNRDEGNLWPFKKLESGKYDLNQWDEQYWSKFENFLEQTEKREIIVQIELWDRFDFSREPWLSNPMNPKNNINYTSTECGMDEEYPVHPGADLQPFFHIVEGMERYDPKLELIKEYQNKLMDKILSYTFNYGNILYCMDNETNTAADWGNYWIEYIREKANKKGVEVYLTDMYEEFHSLAHCKKCQELIAKPEFYTFMDISQINNRVYNEDHWKSLQLVMEEREKYDLRPVNCTKVYGGMHSDWGSGSNQDGVERFCRNVIGGCAVVRHHRPEYGNGLNEKSKASIKAVRKVETILSLWEINTRMDLLANREEDEAYLASNENGSYLVYFTQGGNVTILADNQETKNYKLNWVSVEDGEWGKEETLENNGNIELTAPDESGWFAVVTEIN